MSHLLRILALLTISSCVCCSKVDKKSAIVARHHTDKCADYGAVSKKCHMWKDLGFCFKHRKEMQYVCSKTCKFCDPGVTHWTYSVSPDENAEAKTNIALTPTLEVMGKKKALYLSSKDIAGMLQSISDKPSPTASSKELAVIQGRIQKVAPTSSTRNTSRVLEEIPQEKPQATVGGKVQMPPVEIVDEKEERKEESKHDSPQEKVSVTGNKEIDNKLLNLMSSLVRINNEKNAQPKEAQAQQQSNEQKPEEKPKDSSANNAKNPPQQENKQQGALQNLQLAIPNLLQVLENLNGKPGNSEAKENKTEQKQQSKPPADKPKADGIKDQESSSKTKTLLAALRLVKSIGPLPPGALNNSNILEQLRTAAEEASVAMKLLNKTGIPEQDNTQTVTDGNNNYNVQLLKEQLDKSKAAAAAANTAEQAKPSADASTVSKQQPQLTKFIISLQDAINAQQSQPSAATSIKERGGVATKEIEGKPVLSEVIPFDIKIDNSDSHEEGKTSNTEAKAGFRKDNQQSLFESDEQKIMNILKGLDDSNKKMNDDDGSREVVQEIRSAYDELGEVINGVEQDEGITTESKPKVQKEQDESEPDDEDEDEDEDKPKKKKKKAHKEEEEEDSSKKKKHRNSDRRKKKKKDAGDNNGDDDDDNDEYRVFGDFADQTRKKKPLTRKYHLDKVLSYIRKAEDHLKSIGGKPLKKPIQKPKDEEADTRGHKEGTNWKMLATKLARQLGLVLKKMAEKDQKLLAEKNRLQGVLATLAQTENQKANDIGEVHSDDDDADEDDEVNEEDRSKIIHNMATKLLSFSRTVHEAQRDNELRTPRKKKRVLHNLVSRYRSIVAKILSNWVKLKHKGRKKSGIPKQGLKSSKRGDIVRSKATSNTNKTAPSSSSTVNKIVPYTPTIGNKPPSLSSNVIKPSSLSPSAANKASYSPASVVVKPSTPSSSIANKPATPSSTIANKPATNKQGTKSSSVVNKPASPSPSFANKQATASSNKPATATPIGDKPSASPTRDDKKHSDSTTTNDNKADKPEQTDVTDGEQDVIEVENK